jgi:hypothetical protein
MGVFDDRDCVRMALLISCSGIPTLSTSLALNPQVGPIGGNTRVYVNGYHFFPGHLKCRFLIDNGEN